MFVSIRRPESWCKSCNQDRAESPEWGLVVSQPTTSSFSKMLLPKLGRGSLKPSLGSSSSPPSHVYPIHRGPGPGQCTHIQGHGTGTLMKPVPALLLGHGSLCCSETWWIWRCLYLPQSHSQNPFHVLISDALGRGGHGTGKEMWIDRLAFLLVHSG